jgi:hypothetical protein
MAIPKYSINNEPIISLLTWVRSGEIAIPEIQRPFVWDPAQVRDLLDSLLNGYPVGYLILWRNPAVRLKDGTQSAGKRILIDGQQRITALMAALLGHEIITKQYRRRRIRIAFHPHRQQFEVTNSAIEKDSSWIPDIAVLFDSEFRQHRFVTDYCTRNPEADPDDLHEKISRLTKITNNQLGIIELDSSLDIETVTEIFIRVNSAGIPLSQADFAMSKIAVNKDNGGADLRKAIDYFCHLASTPGVLSNIEKHDRLFAQTDYFSQMRWLSRETDDLYDPNYSDMLRVAFTSQFRRGRLADLVALLSGRNFETKQYEQSVIDDTFNRLREGVFKFSSESNFQRFIMIIRSAGFISSYMTRSQMALNFAYVLFLTLRDQGVAPAQIEHYVRCWYVMSILTGRYSGSPESNIDYDVRQIDAIGIDAYADSVIRGELSNAFWEVTLPQEMQTSVAFSPYFLVYLAAQVKMNDLGFLSRDITVRDLIEYRSDLHHVFPRDFLKRAGKDRGEYNQIANYVVMQSEINIAIGNRAPAVYFGQLLEQCDGGLKRYGNITDRVELERNLRAHCIPDLVFDATTDHYPHFLDSRRRLMALKIRDYFRSL